MQQPKWQRKLSEVDTLLPKKVYQARNYYKLLCVNSGSKETCVSMFYVDTGL